MSCSAETTSTSVSDIDGLPCELCGSPCEETDNQILLCDSCDKGYHQYCLPSPIEVIPTGPWFCPSCCQSSTASTQQKQGHADPVPKTATKANKSKKRARKKVLFRKRKKAKPKPSHKQLPEHEDDDIPCVVCHRYDSPRENAIILCDLCDQGYHQLCLKPRLKVIPPGNWFCPKCSSKRSLKKRKCEVEREVIQVDSESNVEDTTPVSCQSQVSTVL